MVLNNFLCFQNDNKSNLREENSQNMNWNGKVLWLTSPASRGKRKVIYVKKIAETQLEIAKCDK